MAELKLDKHPDKTWVGKIERGFDFLGYHHTPAGLSPVKSTLARFYAQLTRLQEQGAHPERIRMYKTRWWRWVRAGLPKNLVLVIPVSDAINRGLSP